MADAPQVAYSQSDLHIDQSPEQAPSTYQYDFTAWSATSPSPLPTKGAVVHRENGVETTLKPSTILGLQPRLFWILFVLAIVLVGGTIGGSVGGVLAVQNSRYELRSVKAFARTLLMVDRVVRARAMQCLLVRPVQFRRRTW
jgi:hypothetical protein